MSYNKRTAFIFAAGLGTRLQPLTLTRPKALVEIKGKPLLQLAIEKLEQAGFQRIVINTHHFAEQIASFISGHKFDAEILISHEKNLLLDTGGGILAAKELIGDKPFLAYNVDILSDIDLRKLYEAHKEEDLATLFVSDRVTSRYLLFDENKKMVGWQNVKSGEVRTPHSKLDLAKCKGLAFNGVHVISPRIFSLMQEWQMPFSITNFYISACGSEAIRAYIEQEAHVLDVGKIDVLERLNRC